MRSEDKPSHDPDCTSEDRQDGHTSCWTPKTAPSQDSQTESICTACQHRMADHFEDGACLQWKCKCVLKPVLESTESPCKTCKGKGKWCPTVTHICDDKKCPDCNGTGIQPTESWEDDMQMKWAKRLGMLLRTGDAVSPDTQLKLVMAFVGLEREKAAHTTALEAAKTETAKAYGGCVNCYGKGYATYTQYAAVKGAKWPISGPMKFCACDRGKQLEGMVEAAKREVREEAEIALARKVLAVSSGVHKVRGATQKKRLQLLTNKMMEIIPDSGFGIVEERLSHPNQPKQEGGQL